MTNRAEDKKRAIQKIVSLRTKKKLYKLVQGKPAGKWLCAIKLNLWLTRSTSQNKLMVGSVALIRAKGP